MEILLVRNFTANIVGVEVVTVEQGKDNAGSKFARFSFVDGSVNPLLARNESLHKRVCLFDQSEEVLAIFEDIAATFKASYSEGLAKLKSFGLGQIKLTDYTAKDMEPWVPLYSETRSFATGKSTVKGQPVVEDNGDFRSYTTLSIAVVQDPSWGIVMNPEKEIVRMMGDTTFCMKLKDLQAGAVVAPAAAPASTVVTPAPDANAPAAEQAPVVVDPAAPAPNPGQTAPPPAVPGV